MRDLLIKYGNLIDVLESAQNMIISDDRRVLSRMIDSKITIMQKCINAVFSSVNIEIVVRKKSNEITKIESDSIKRKRVSLI